MKVKLIVLSTAALSAATLVLIGVQLPNRIYSSKQFSLKSDFTDYEITSDFKLYLPKGYVSTSTYPGRWILSTEMRSVYGSPFPDITIEKDDGLSLPELCRYCDGLYDDSAQTCWHRSLPNKKSRLKNAGDFVYCFKYEPYPTPHGVQSALVHISKRDVSYYMTFDISPGLQYLKPKLILSKLKENTQ